MIRRALTAFLLLAALGVQAIAQTCLPVPSLPDLERRTQRSITASTGPLNVGFAIYGDATDFTDWIQVFVNGTLTTAYTLTSPSGSVATLCRPIVDAQITFTTAQTGTVQIVGARRPRRTSQFTENRGVAARDINQVVSDLVAQNRETWDWRNRVLQGVPGDSFGVLPAPAVRKNTILGFGSDGSLAYLPLGPTISVTAGSTFNSRILAAAASIDPTVQFVQTAGFGTAGDAGDAIYVRAGGTTPGGFQSADGAWWAIANKTLWAAQFGAKCDNAVTDDNAAFVTLFSAAISFGREARYQGRCRSSASLSIPDSIRFSGINVGTSVSVLQGHGVEGNGSILVFDAAANGIVIDTTKQVVITDMAIEGQSVSTTGIRVTSSTYVNNASIFNNLFMYNWGVCLHWQTVTGATLANSNFAQCSITTLRSEDTFIADSGDSTVYANTFNGVAGLSTISYVSAGGLRFVNNKINGGRICFDMNLSQGTVTGDLFLNGNSMEGCTAAAVSIARTGGDGHGTSYQVVNISGNELAGGNYAVFFAPDGAELWLQGVVVNSNNLLCDTACVYLSQINGGSVTGNTMRSISGSPNPIINDAAHLSTNLAVGLNPRIGSFSGSAITCAGTITCYAPY